MSLLTSFGANMARLPNDLITRLKQDISLVRLMESQGHVLKKQGKDQVTTCPFHDDKTPSLIISPDTNLWHCMGACQTGGSVIDWVIKTQGVSFRRACELLQNDLGLVTSHKPLKQATNKTIDSPLAADMDKTQMLGKVIDFYHSTLKQSPEVLDYLKSRGLTHPELIDTFKLGFANRTLAYRLPAKNRQAGADIRNRLVALGILRHSGHEHFNGSLVVPVLDEQGQVQEVYGRKITTGLRKGTPLHLYLSGSHVGVWNIQALKASEEIILCEALIDAMTFWVHGYRHVTSSYGISGFTDDILVAFKRYGTKRVLIAYDRDKAGNLAAEKLAVKLMDAGIECFRVILPMDMDVNQYASSCVLNPAESLGQVLRRSEWMGKGKAPATLTLAAKEAIVEVIDTDTGEILSDPDLGVSPTLVAPTQASPIPPSTPTVEAIVNDHEILITLGDRVYRIRGLQKNMSYDLLKVNVLVRRNNQVNDHFHVDTLDIYHAKQRTSYLKQASIELGLEESTLKKDMGQILVKLEQLQDQQIKDTLTPTEKTVSISDQEQQDALTLLKDPNLLQQILKDFNGCGLIGEDTNKLVGYLASVSRKLAQPLAVMIQSSSAAGKSSLMDAILAFMPEEEQVHYSAMTGQSLFYMGETNLKHKILSISEEEGAEQASYALKLLQSEGEITIASTGKDASTGNLTTQEYRVEGPVMLFLTTTAIDIDEELMNRCLVLSVNESREQTQAIHQIQRQRQTLEGLLAEQDSKDILQRQRNAQRLLQPFLVANPYADQLTFLDDKTRTRRDHMKYLTLIRAIALLHQYQRPIKTKLHQGKEIRYIEVIPQDIETANRLAHEVLGKTLDELPPQTRKLLQHIHTWVIEQCQNRKIAAILNLKRLYLSMRYKISFIFIFGQ
jgi:DNA primase